MAIDSDQEKFFSIGTDLMLTPWLYQDVVEWNVRWLANHPWIEVVTFSDLLGRGWEPINHGDLALSADKPLERYPCPQDEHYNAYFWQFYYGGTSDGHSPLIPFGAQIEGYFDYVPYLRDGEQIPSGMKMGDDNTPGTIVYETLHNLRAAPENSLVDLAWRSYLTSTGEQTFHVRTDYEGGQEPGEDWRGQFLHPAAKFRANYLGQVNKIVAAANWAHDVQKGIQPASTQILSQDLDLDGEDEYIMKNNRIFAIFENDGGKLEYAFACDPALGPVQLVAPVNQVNVSPSPGWNFENGEIPPLMPAYDRNVAAFVERDYADDIFKISIGETNLTLTSGDSQITKALSLEGDTITAQYLTTNTVEIDFAIPVNMANMYSRNWAEKIVKIDKDGCKGWKVSDGGYAVVNLLDTDFLDMHSFTDSPANEEMQEREDSSSYPKGHGFLFPFNTVTVTGSGDFEVSLTFRTKSETEGEDGGGESDEGGGATPCFVSVINGD